MGNARLEPIEYIQKRIEIMDAHIEQIDSEIEGRRKDHERIIGALNDAKRTYIGALTVDEELGRLSLGKDFREQRQRMQQIIRGVNTGIFDEVRTFKGFLKSLNAERRRIESDVSLLELRRSLLED